MLLDAPFSDPLLRRPRLAESAAPAAICCFFDFAGMQKRAPRESGRNEVFSDGKEELRGDIRAN
jgi:hypothetical protein